MVLLHLKVRVDAVLKLVLTGGFRWPYTSARLQRSEQNQYLYETTVEALVKDVTRELAGIHNMKQRITKLKIEGGELAQYGPAKQPDQQGIDTYSDKEVVKGQFYAMDPTGRRTGNGAHDQGRQWCSTITGQWATHDQDVMV